MDKFPAEIKMYKQWAIAGAPDEPFVQNKEGEWVPNKAPHVWSNTANKLVNVSVNDVDKLMTYEDAEKIGRYYGLYVGFVLTTADPYCCIDLDVKDYRNAPNKPELWTKQSELDRFTHIMAAFDTYTEKSQSRMGVHLWLKGAIGEGCRRDGVEVYSQQRFIICTGDVIANIAVADRQDLIILLVEEIRKGKKSAVKFELVEIEEVEDDWEIHVRALEADNGEKYDLLCQGKWEIMGYPSQSEADLALMSIYTFYSASNEQCRRMFRMTALGKREKANKNNRHLDYILRLIRARQARDAISESDSLAQARLFAQQLQAAHQVIQQVAHPEQLVSGLSVVPEVHQGTEYMPTEPVQPYTNVELPVGGAMDWPPGLTGELAKYIYKTSKRPTKEVSILCALGFLAGVCGKSWNVSNSGLNLYLILVGKTGIGKEALATGLALVVQALRTTCPQVDAFVSFDTYASGQALQKTVTSRPSFVNKADEIGHDFLELSSIRPSSNVLSKKKLWLELFQKSGQNDLVGGLAYSDKEQNTKTITGVAYTLLGETTPEMFYETLGGGIMKDGFLSRFMLVEHNGKRPPYNKNPDLQMDPNLKDALTQILNQSLTLTSRYQVQDVVFTQEADALCDEFNTFCDIQMDTLGEDESRLSIYNRAHFKLLRISALLAVGDNWVNPTVHLHHVQWAKKTVEDSMNLLIDKLDSGQIGSGDDARCKALANVILRYMNNKFAPKRKELRDSGIVTWSDIQGKTANLASFKNHRNGSTNALVTTLDSLVKQGCIVPVSKEKGMELRFTGIAYAVQPELKRDYGDNLVRRSGF